MKLNSLLFNLSIIASLSFTNVANADAFTPTKFEVSQTDFGGVGLMQMPSGRMAPEGELNVGGTFNNEYYHGTVSLQLMPWAETTIRYTSVKDLLYSSYYELSGDTSYTDKGIDLKFRLLKESNWLPETSIGIRDIGGTGLFDGEFIAATKRFSNIDFTLGMGWGYLGQSGNISNPFCTISDSYCERSNEFNETGGTIEYSKWFKGSSALFGGIEYQTPYQPLRLKVEYDSNDYSGDFPVTKGATDMTQHTPWNFGVLYDVKNWGDLRISYERGDTLTLGFTFKANFNNIKPLWRDAPEPAFQPSSKSENTNWNNVANELASNAGYQNTEITTSEKNITVKGSQTKYRDSDIAQKRAALLLSQARTPDIETYTFIETNKGMDMIKTEFDADKFDLFANNEYIGAKLDDAKLSPDSSLEQQDGTIVQQKNNKLNYGLDGTLTQSFGSAENFYLYAVGVTAKSTYQLTPKLELAGAIYFNFFDNYDEFNYVENSPYIDNFSVPRVRSLFRYYVHDNPVRMTNLQLTWFDRLSENSYFQGYGGYLESMFAGVGGEILYRPKNSNWAIGADINLISQRDPDNWFSTYSDDYFEFDGGCDGGVYTTNCAAYVLSQGETGFVNIYYKPQLDFLGDTLIQANIGQFLGQDKGVRFDVSKRFNSGIIAGAYASFTDLSSEDFGEGSFTKGFYVSIPFDVMTIKPSRTRAVLNWQPLTRDGGQKLNRKYNLYELTDTRSPWFTQPISN
jgi:hypothetical protein